ncbi:glucose-6-phosphate isomerase [Candidatus Micrarchaeota archaeon]|nr:glucose-6-phosphate isomerase [Candidatus Micrarchaeota archaeon]
MKLYEMPLVVELKGTDLIVNDKENECSIRKLQAMSDVLMDPVFGKTEDEFNAYYMYRSVYQKNDIRFDITLLPSRLIGKEYTKTYGHYHPKPKHQDLAYPEVYQVLKGEAAFVLQNKTKGGGVEVILVKAKEKQVVLFPPNYGHVSINTGQGPLVLSNLVYDKFKSDYSDYKMNKGAAYYYTEDGLIQNTNYVIKSFETTDVYQINKKYGFFSDDLLNEFYKFPEKFEFLKDPDLLSK